MFAETCEMDKPRQNCPLLLGEGLRHGVEGRVGDAGRNELEGLSAEVEAALLEAHEGRRCEDALVGTESENAIFFLTWLLVSISQSRVKFCGETCEVPKAGIIFQCPKN